MFEFGRFSDSIFAAFFCAFLNIAFTFPELEEELYHLEDDDEDNGCFDEDTSWALPVLVVAVAAAVVFIVVVVVPKTPKPRAAVFD